MYILKKKIKGIDKEVGEEIEIVTVKDTEALFILQLLLDLGYIEESTGEWKPERGESYYWVDGRAEFFEDSWTGHPTDERRASFLGVYKTKEEAEAVVEKIKRLRSEGKL